jgi:hypothetical protein
MKKIVILACALFFANTLFAQSLTVDFTYNGLDYMLNNQNNTATVLGLAQGNEDATTITIPATITHEGNPYTVTAIGNSAFGDLEGVYNNDPNAMNTTLTSVTIPNTITSIGEGAFVACFALSSINIPNSVETIENGAFMFCIGLSSITFEENSSLTSIEDNTFYGCIALESIDIPNNVTTIENFAFLSCLNLTSITIPSSVNFISGRAFLHCEQLTSVTCLGRIAPVLETYAVFSSTPDSKTLTIPFGSNYENFVNSTNWEVVYHKIYPGECGFIDHNNPFEVTASNKIINQGILVIEQGGELINYSDENVEGIIEVETPVLPNNSWSFIGAPFSGYKLEAIIPGERDIAISMFNYDSARWSNQFDAENQWGSMETEVGIGEGFFAWSFANEASSTAFTTYGNGAYSPTAHSDFDTCLYDFSTTVAYNINKDTLNVTKDLIYNSGYWLPLANPYTFKLDIEKFLQHNLTIQGGVIYKLTQNTNNEPVWQTLSSGEILLTEGFFVNLIDDDEDTLTKLQGGYVRFNLDQRFINSYKSSPRSFIKLVMKEGDNESKLLFAHNEKAQQDYDIFDANKLFSPSNVTEHYFVNNDKALVKEEVNSLPYSAKLNVRSYDKKEVCFTVEDIPEDVAVYLIDNGYETKMNNNQEYRTYVLEGENENRFQLLVKKQHRLETIKSEQISITNNNREVKVASQVENLTIEIYNSLGQKVFTTKDYNFILNTIPAGTYTVKAFYNRISQTQKIVIE